MKFLINAKEILLQVLLDNIDHITAVDFQGDFSREIRDYLPQKFMKQLKKRKSKRKISTCILFSDYPYINPPEHVDKILNIVFVNRMEELIITDKLENYDIILSATNIFDLYTLPNYALQMLEKNHQSAALIVNKALLHASEVSQISLDVLRDATNVEDAKKSLLITEFNREKDILIITTSIYAGILIEEIIINSQLQYNLVITRQIKPILPELLERLRSAKLAYIIPEISLIANLMKNNGNIIFLSSMDLLNGDIPLSIDLYRVFNNMFRKVDLL